MYKDVYFPNGTSLYRRARGHVTLGQQSCLFITTYLDAPCSDWITHCTHAVQRTRWHALKVGSRDTRGWEFRASRLRGSGGEKKQYVSSGILYLEMRLVLRPRPFFGPPRAILATYLPALRLFGFRPLRGAS